MNSEEEIIEGCINENKAAQEALYKKYASKLMGVSMRYAKDQMEAEDILHDALVKIFDNIKGYSNKGSFVGWMVKITVNTALNKIRSRNKNLSYVEEYTEETLDFSSSLDTLQLMDLMNLMEKMPEGYKLVFNLFAVEGYSHQEIAKQLGIEEVTSRTQFAKARKYLQRLILKLEE
jgi:RNA polymerase sigma-70 factor (ECF subfamily)